MAILVERRLAAYCSQSIDSQGDSDSLPGFTLTVTKGSNLAPTVGDILPPLVGTTRLFSFTPSAAEPTSDSYCFSISGLPHWASFNPAMGQLTGTPIMCDIGIYGLTTITVTYSYGASSSYSFYLEVVCPKEVDKFGVLPSAYLLLGGEDN